MASGGGTVGGSGTPGTLPIWTAATTLGDSAISQVAGAIATVTLTAGGAGYTSATYSQQALTGGTGTGATADIVVAGGIVTSCVLRSPGTGYTAADALSCATIGAGAGFVVTVATVTTSDNTAGNLTALGRIGAGTATPRAALDAVGGGMLSGMQLNALWNSAAGVPGATSYTALQIDNSLSASNTFVIPAGLAGGAVRGINAYLRVNASNVASGTSFNYGAAAQISLAETGPGAISGYGGFFSAAVNTTGLSGKTIPQLYGTSGQILVQAAGGTNTFSDAAVFFSSHSVSATTVQNFTKYSIFNGAAAGSFSGAAHVVTNYYGIQLGTPSLSAGSTITNRWGISQEDTLASNQFSAVTNTFSGIVRATGSTAAAPAFSTPADTDTGLYFPSANTVRIATAGSPGLEIDSSQNLKFNSGYGSTTTAYGCRVWINFIGATAVIRGSGGVSSLTRPSAGTYIINYTTTMPDTGYAALATKQSVASNSDCQLYDLFASRTTTSSTWVNVEGAAVADSANINIAFFR
jgi:hypothetical protein